MKRLTTLALLAGMLSAPALHSEEPGSGAAAPLSFPQLNDAADSEPGDEPPAASPEEGASPPPPPPGRRGRRPPDLQKAQQRKEKVTDDNHDHR
ncbi:hypothetical protein WOC75_06165, partial [Klebsiella pneumoniae]|uniref:hypothetical protein n=1 Tax=Klebsiella pneumoniae TaxID=573 RepID=UPI0030F139FE